MHVFMFKQWSTEAANIESGKQAKKSWFSLTCSVYLDSYTHFTEPETGRDNKQAK